MTAIESSELSERDREIIRTSRFVDEPFLGAVVRRIVAVSGATKVILFGSRAQGLEHSDSDVDLFVVVAGPADERREKRRAISRSLVERIIPIDILVRTEDEVERAATLGDPLIQDEILPKGRVLYAR